MPSFDIVSEVSWMNIQNILGGVERALNSRWDFRGSAFEVEGDKANKKIKLEASSPLHLQQMVELLKIQMVKQEVETQALIIPEKPEHVGQRFRLWLELKEGIPKTLSKAVAQKVRDEFPKVQVQIQGEKLTVTAKSKDVLQASMMMLKAETWERPLQFKHFRD